MKNASVKKGIIIIFIANIINLLLSLVRNFLLPKYLSIDAYAAIKSYQLYITFISLCALGYIDGMYLKYGGMNEQNIDKKSFLANLSTFRILQLIISVIVVIIGVLLGNYIVIALGMTIVALNSTDYLKSYYQAIGEYKKYSNTISASSIVLFLCTIVLLLIFKEKDPIYYIFCNVFVYYFVWILLELKLEKSAKLKNKYFLFSTSEFKESVCNGLVLMLGLMISNFMTGLDRIFIKITLTTSIFAIYSFAASMESFLNYAISPISITLYNYFCREKKTDKINKLRLLIIIFLTFLISAAFPIKWIVENYITKYSQSIKVLFILFAGQLFYAIIRCFYINLYKANKQQKQYFKRIIIVLGIGIISNILLFLILHTMEAYAIGTFLTAIIWLILCECDYKENSLNKKEKKYLIFMCSIYLIYGICLNSVMGMILYILTNMLIVLLFFRNDISEFITNKTIFKIIRKFKKVKK